MTRSRFLVVVACVVLANGVHADEARFEVTPWLGLVTGGSIDDVVDDETLDLGDGSYAALSFNIAAPNGGSYEFYYARQDTDLESGGLLAATPVLDLTIEYLQFGGTYGFETDQGFQPYGLLTIGAARFTPDAPGLSDETCFAATIGAGMRFDVSRALAIKLEARAMVNFVDSDSAIFCDSGGGNANCAVAIRSDSIIQWSASAGLAYRF